MNEKIKGLGVFVLNMPDNCYDCPLRVYADCYIIYACQDITNWDFEETDNDVFEIFCKCPLIPVRQMEEEK